MAQTDQSKTASSLHLSLPGQIIQTIMCHYVLSYLGFLQKLKANTGCAWRWDGENTESFFGMCNPFLSYPLSLSFGPCQSALGDKLDRHLAP